MSRTVDIVSVCHLCWTITNCVIYYSLCQALLTVRSVPLRHVPRKKKWGPMNKISYENTLELFYALKSGMNLRWKFPSPKSLTMFFPLLSTIRTLMGRGITHLFPFPAVHCGHGEGEASTFSTSHQCANWIEVGRTWFFKLMGDANFHLRIKPDFTA